MSVSNQVTRRLVIVLVSIVVLVVGVLLLVLSEAIQPKQPWKWLLDVIGGFLSISVITSFLYSVTLRKIDDANQKNVLQSLLNEQVERLIKGYARYGLGEFCENMDFKRLFDSLQKGDELWWLDTYAPGHINWIEHLGDAINRGARIKMLVIDPNSDNACFRAKEIGGFFEETKFLGNLNSFIADLSAYAGNKTSEGGLLELREYSDLPCIPMYLVCRKAKSYNEVRPIYGYTSFFLKKATGVEFPHIRWRTGQFSLLEHFFAYILQKWHSLFIVSVVSPKPGEEVDNNRPHITASFSVAIASASITANAFKLEPVKNDIMTPVQGTVTYDSHSNAASFTPSGKLEPGLYQATITTDVTDLGGIPLVEKHTWQFTVKQSKQLEAPPMGD